MAISCLFIAADRSSAHAVAAFAADAVALGYRVLWNTELPSGDAWWARTLDDVERADAFIYAMTSSSITSAVCQEQLHYAIDLGKPVLPVLVAGDVSDVDLPSSLGQLQRIDYRVSSAASMAELFSDIRGLTPEPPPATPPLRPQCPAEFTLDLVARLSAPAILTRPEQETVLNQLTRYVGLGFTAVELRQVLTLLRERRPDLTVMANSRLDGIEAQLGGSRASAAPPPPPTPATTAPEGEPPVRTLFVSYSRSERAIIDRLVDDLRRLGFTVWIDQNLPGGKPWWDQVLLNIRQCDAFLFAAGPDSLRSRACRAELGYARGNGRPIVRVDVAPAEPRPDPDPVGEATNAGAYAPDDKASMARLAQTLRRVSKTDAPAVPPPPPEVPATYLFDVQSRLRSPDELDLQAQQELLTQVRRYAGEGVGVGDLRRLLDTFQRRPDTTMRTAEAIAALREELHIPPGPVEGDAAAGDAASGADTLRAEEEEEARRAAEEREAAEARQHEELERSRLLQEAEAERQRAAEAERQRAAEIARAQRSRRRLAAVGVAALLVVGGGVGAALLLSGDDDKAGPDTEPSRPTEPTSPVTGAVRPTTEETDPPPPTEPPPPTPGPTAPPFAGVTGNTQVVWQAGDSVYTAIVNTTAQSGTADVQFLDPVLGTLVVHQDLTLIEENGQWYYVGSSPRFPDGTPATTYSPDRFHLTPQGGNVWAFDEVCDAQACYGATTTPL